MTKQYKLSDVYTWESRVEEHPEDPAFKRFSHRLLRYGEPTPTDKWNFPFGRKYRKTKETTEEILTKIEKELLPRWLETQELKELLEKAI